MSQFDDPEGAMPQPELPPDPAMDFPADSPVAAPAEPSDQAAGHGVPQEKLDRRVVAYWLISGVIGWLFMAVLLLGGVLFAHFKWPAGASYVLAGATALAGLLLIVALVSPPLAYARWRFSVDGELLLANYGILFLEEKAIPISRLQHVDLYRGLIERFFGLTTLVVFTAGTEGAHFRLPGLAAARARELRDMILAARGDDVI